jgi:hypothetical protein
MLPESATELLRLATGDRQVPPEHPAQALYGMLTSLGVPDDPAQYGPAAVFIGHGALYVFNLFSGELEALKLAIPPDIMEVFRQVTADVATVFRDVANYAEEIHHDAAQADGQEGAAVHAGGTGEVAGDPPSER